MDRFVIIIIFDGFSQQPKCIGLFETSPSDGGQTLMMCCNTAGISPKTVASFSTWAFFEQNENARNFRIFLVQTFFQLDISSILFF